MRRGRTLALACWALFVGVGIVIVARARYTADLSAFLPKAPSPEQRLLIDQLREGPASRLILVALDGAPTAELALYSRTLRTYLGADPQFQVVSNGDASALNNDRALVFAQRYLLSDRVNPDLFSPGGLRTAIASGIDDLASPVGMLAKDLFVRDPTGETLQVLAQWDRTTRPPTHDGVWVSADGRRALLVVQTRAMGSDTDGQSQAIASIRRAFAQAHRSVVALSSRPLHTQLRLSGPGVFAVAARTTIEREAIRFSVLSSLLIAAFLLSVYRSLPMLLLGLLPVASGALAGVAAVALGFGTVHALTLGFGATLIGEAVDYSVYLFLQRHGGSRGAAGALWPTIWLGMLTSVCGFASLLPSGFPGLAQLGLYSIAGLVAAALVTRYVLFQLMPTQHLDARRTAALGIAFAKVVTAAQPWRALLALLAVLMLTVLYLNRATLWQHELSALSPVAITDQILDARLRADLGAPDVRTLIIISGRDSEAVLQSSEAVSRKLERLIADGVIADYQSPTRFLPSLATQATRRASLPDAPTLSSRLSQSLTGLPIHAAQLAEFKSDIAAARVAPLLNRAALDHTSIASAFDAMMVRHGEQWNALLPLEAVAVGSHAFTIDTERLRRTLGVAPSTTDKSGAEVVVLDLKRESDHLYASYLSEAIRLSLAGLAAIVLLLLIVLRHPLRIARVLAPLLLAVVVVAAGLTVLGQPLNLLHLIGLLLIVAIGSNYALFFDRETRAAADSETRIRTLTSLLVANLTTVIGFGTLAFSTVPVLTALGTTVAPGAFLSLVFAAVLAQRASN